MLVIYNKEGRTEKDLNDLVWYMVAGTVLGARLGHCMFYSPEYYLANPTEILMIWKGGLSSHGAAIGILAALLLYIRSRKGFTFLWIMDRIAIAIALGAFFIRMGNLFNSEIIGKPTDVPWAFIFSIIDGQPRHPTQIYEALAYLIVFFLLFNIYFQTKEKIKEGKLLGLFLILVFGFRFFVEFLKENQSQFEEAMVLNMGQLLSIPLIIYGIYILNSKRDKTIKH